jgi:protein with PEP-CTERM/exosortase system signal
MNTNIVPPKKVGPLSVVLCAVMLAFAQNAGATPHALPPSTSLTIGDAHELGKVFFGEPSGDANRTAYVNAMIGLALGGSTHVIYPGKGHDNLVTRSFNDFGPLASPAVLVLNGTGTSIDLGSGLYSYLFAKYDGPNGGVEVWYVGKLSGDITIPAIGFGPPGTDKYGLSGWTLFGPGVTPPGVPDGGATVTLLGAALGVLGVVRRYLFA